MLFNSLEFLVFFVAVYSLYLLLPHRKQNWLLLAASLLFYGCWDWRFLSLILFSTTVDYFCGLKIHKAPAQKTKKIFLLMSIISNLSLLAFVKYFNFFAANLIALAHTLGLSWSPKILRVILPVGISFYTFQALSYTIDIYRGKVSPTRNFWDFSLFVAFFPQLVAGPIERAGHLLPQVENPRRVSLPKFYEGCFLISWGLFEKIFVAGNLARIVDPVFDGGAPYEGLSVLIALYAFAFQIFCDFDGYSNIARGLGLCLGFDLMVNFRLPYFATNPREFWQRWHISLSTWLRDYLYIPLGGNRVSKFLNMRNLLLTMLLGGLWHGASWTFVLWGMYHGLLLTGHRLLSRGGASPAIYPPLHASRTTLHGFLSIIIVFHLVTVGWLFFRATSLQQVGDMTLSLLHFENTEAAQKLWRRFAFVVLPLLAVQLWQFKSDDLLILFRQHWLVKTCVYALMAYLILGYGILKPEEFIYFQF